MEAFFENFCDNLIREISQDHVSADVQTHLIEYIRQYRELFHSLKTSVPVMPIMIVPSDVTAPSTTKPARAKNIIADIDRCIGCRADGQQCTRRKKNDTNYCGTHAKGTPYGVVEGNESSNMKAVEIWAEDRNGIVNYVDGKGNIYKTEDILSGKIDPAIHHPEN